jgi:8-oxo-dGTP diphosphatase
MHLFSSRDFSGAIKDCDEGVLEWVPKSRVPELNLWEGDLIFFRLMEENRPFFSLKLTYVDGELTQVELDGTPLHRQEFGTWS